jgi:hypothetical protein
MRSRASRLVSLLAALAMAVVPVAARAHLAAAGALGLDLCTTPVDGKAPAGAALGEHCECCIGAAAIPLARYNAGRPPAVVPRGAGENQGTSRAQIIPVLPPRGPPAGSLSLP